MCPSFIRPTLTLVAAFACAAAASFAASTSSQPNPLIARDGSLIRGVEDWQTKRRPEILELFREHVYGRAPVARPDSLRFETSELSPAFEGKARRRQVRIAYSGPGGESDIGLACYYPPAETPIRGVFVLIVNRSRRIIDEAETRPNEFWPVADILARGYATAAFHYRDVAPDDKNDDFKSGVFGVFDSPARPRADDAWGAVAAWAWGASRAIDYLETDPLLKNVPVAVAGHSRGGKTALWCGAQDERVALSISNDSGTTGAALARASKGETIRRINEVFPHWFALNYRRYNDQPESMPVDQHLLVAAIAPRLVCIGSASEDANADPAAEFRSGVQAAPAYSLFGLDGVKPDTFPAVGEARQDGRVGYHLRAGPHDLRREDWVRYLDFADRWMRPGGPR